MTALLPAPVLPAPARVPPGRPVAPAPLVPVSVAPVPVVPVPAVPVRAVPVRAVPVQVLTGRPEPAEVAAAVLALGLLRRSWPTAVAPPRPAATWRPVRFAGARSWSG